MPLLIPHPKLCVAGGTTGLGRGLASIAAAALRRSYRDAVRLGAQEEIPADLAEEAVIARLHADTARFHHGSAHAYAKALHLLLGKAVSVSDDNQAAKVTTRVSDLAPMRCRGRRYHTFEPHQL